jgi:uncharacterized protein (DUF1697 family)
VHVVFLRGVNVGGARTFRPAELARSLADLQVRSIQAAGTFVVRADAPAARVRRAFEQALPFAADVLVRPADEVRALRKPRAPPGAQVFLTVLASAPRHAPRLPADWPEEGAWELRLARLDGPYALTLRRAKQAGRLYPNEVLERALGVRGTTRGWPTVELVQRALEPAQPSKAA